MPEQFDSTTGANVQPAAAPFSGEACNQLSAAIRDYLTGGGLPEGLARITSRLCREAQQRGLSADETLAEIRSTLSGIFAACPLTTSDRAAIVALAIDECVHGFYTNHR